MMAFGRERADQCGDLQPLCRASLERQGAGGCASKAQPSSNFLPACAHGGPSVDTTLLIGCANRARGRSSVVKRYFPCHPSMGGVRARVTSRDLQTLADPVMGGGTWTCGCKEEILKTPLEMRSGQE